jgi:hypothetical protein
MLNQFCAVPPPVVDIELEPDRPRMGDEAKLIGLLIADLDPADEGDVESAREEEVLARSREIRDGRVVPVPAGEVLARVRRRLT